MIISPYKMARETTFTFYLMPTSEKKGMDEYPEMMRKSLQFFDDLNRRSLGIVVVDIPNDLLSAFIYGLKIKPGYRRLGYGSVLLQKVFDFIDEKGVKTVSGQVRNDENVDWLLQFYKRYGLEPCTPRGDSDLFTVYRGDKEKGCEK